MLKSWGLLEFTSANKYDHAPRKGRELHVYSVTGWVRRIKKGQTDGDWHIELTARQNSPPESCIVVEIPLPEYSGKYDVARHDLDQFLAPSTIASNGDVTPPQRLRFIGAAFFDNEHRGAASSSSTASDQTEGSHGRCNSSARALWELHPVYWVKTP